MLKTVFFILTFGVFSLLHAQSSDELQPVYSVTLIHQNLEFYKTQAKLWKKETQKNKKDGTAWFNLFNAARMANAFTPSGEDRPYDMNEIAENIKTNLPNTFEFHYLSFWQNNPSEEGYRHLQKAYELSPDRHDTYHAMITKAEYERDLESIKKFSELWYKHPFYSPGITNWNYNVLASVEQNAIIITQGDNDTYPLWLLQQVKNIRTDVGVINAHIILVEDYRNLLFKELGIAPFEEKAESFKSHREFQEAVLDHIIQSSKRPIYIGLSIPQYLREKWEDNLYLTGLTFKYSEEEFDNKAVLRNNFENRFLKDYLKVDLYDDFSKTVVHFMNQQYIPCLTVLHKHYKMSGEDRKKQEVEEILLKIAKESNREEEINNYLSSN